MPFQANKRLFGNKMKVISFLFECKFSTFEQNIDLHYKVFPNLGGGTVRIPHHNFVPPQKFPENNNSFLLKIPHTSQSPIENLALIFRLN